MPIKRLAGFSLAIIAMLFSALVLESCKGKSTESLEWCTPAFSSEVFGEVTPPCVPGEGGRLVTVQFLDEDREDYELPDGVKITKVVLAGVISETISDVTVIENGVRFEAPGSPDTGLVTVTVEGTMEEPLAGYWEETGEACETVSGQGFERYVGSFEYVDGLRPVLRDGAPIFDLDGTCILNPKPARGDYCGGYETTISGIDFSPDCTVTWGGKVLGTEEVQWISSSILLVMVPPGDEGALVSFWVTNSPSDDCPLKSRETGCFYYNEGPCELASVEESTKLVPDPEASGVIYLDTGALIAGAEIDVVTVQATLSGGSLRVLEGRGDGVLSSALSTGRALEFSEGTPKGVRVGNFDGDSVPDAVVALELEGGAGRISIYFNDGSGYEDAVGRVVSVDLELPPSELVVADLDGDGDDDVLVGSISSSKILSLEQVGSKTVTRQTDLILPSSPFGFEGTVALAIGDYDRLGELDIVAVDIDGNSYVFASGEETIWSAAAPGWGSPRSLPLGVEAAGVPDLVASGDNALVLGALPAEVLQLDIDSAAGGTILPDLETWLLPNPEGVASIVFTTGVFWSSAPYGVAAGFQGGQVVILLDPNSSLSDGRLASLSPSGDVTDIAADFLNSDDPASGMDVVCGVAGSPPQVHVLVNTW